MVCASLPEPKSPRNRTRKARAASSRWVPLSEVRKPTGANRQRSSLGNPKSGGCERLKNREAKGKERVEGWKRRPRSGAFHAGHGSYRVIKTNNHRGEASHTPLQIYTNESRQTLRRLSAEKRSVGSPDVLPLRASLGCLFYFCKGGCLPTSLESI